MWSSCCNSSGKQPFQANSTYLPLLVLFQKYFCWFQKAFIPSIIFNWTSHCLVSILCCSPENWIKLSLPQQLIFSKHLQGFKFYQAFQGIHSVVGGHLAWTCSQQNCAMLQFPEHSQHLTHPLVQWIILLIKTPLFSWTQSRQSHAFGSRCYCRTYYFSSLQGAGFFLNT